MQALDANFGEISFDRGRGKALQPILLGSAALVLVGWVGAVVLHARQAAAPAVVAARPALSAAPSREAASNPFGEIIVDPSFLAEMKPAAPAENSSRLANLEPVPPALSTEAAPPAPSMAPALPDEVPLPPKRDVPQIVDSAPLPPPRPAEFGPPVAPAAPDRRVTQQSGAPAPAGNLNIFQKLFGLGQPSAPAAKSEPAAPSRVARLSTAAPGASASTSPATAPSSAVQEGRGGFGGLLAWFTPKTGYGSFGYDRFTAVYDISARTVYLPDGTRLEAHSGLGEALDNPRYVSERARGPTPPHLYELTMREASFHGVQALRLNPVGEDGLYGRAGLLAHPYMLGPNGDSNGCVSFKDYDAFLRAYENGQIKRLAVVAQL
jgi:Protein of unknown function (DUF2778)